MEDRSSISDPRVEFVAVPGARQLLMIRHDTPNVMVSMFKGAIVWVDPEGRGEGNVDGLVREIQAAGAAAVRVLPSPVEAAPLPAEAGSAPEVSSLSEVRPVVAELIERLPEALRADVSEVVEQLLASQGL